MEWGMASRLLSMVQRRRGIGGVKYQCPFGVHTKSKRNVKNPLSLGNFMFKRDSKLAKKSESSVFLIFLVALSW